jgi:hypothetical protein
MSHADIAREAVRAGVVASISGATVWRWLSADAVKPWSYRSWIFPRDPDFAAKAGRVLDLYQGRWEGQPLGPRDYVISADEKTSIQARALFMPEALPLPRKSAASSLNMNAPERSPIWRPGTSIAPSSSALVKPRPELNPSTAWWTWS